MEKRERLEEEFELQSEELAVQGYGHITSVLSANYNLIADELSELGDFKKGLALDLGTGLGDLALEVGKRYPQLKVIGIDLSQAAVKEAKKKAQEQNVGNVYFQLQDAQRVAFKDSSFDLVISHGTIHHFQDIRLAFYETYRILKPQGLAYLTDLKRDAPEDIVEEVAKNLPEAGAKAFVNSINGAYLGEELQEILNSLGIEEFKISGQSFHKSTIIKNKERLRNSSMRSANYTKLSQTIIIKKHD
ncbi:MAG: class I SAM-dependent methyltransferase [Candidatus Omnitrophica bacterium]|nr:class I SAM-dependent methyltransferase [Candidatus Omnitrophota bacterium]